MQDRLADLRQAVASKNPALADLLPPRASAVYEVRRNDRTDIGVFEAQLGKTQDAEVSNPYTRLQSTTCRRMRPILWRTTLSRSMPSKRA